MVTINDIETLKVIDCAFKSNFVNQNFIVWMENHITISKEKLSQVLYDNIFKVCGGKIKKSDFVNWLSRKTKSLLYADSIKFTTALRSIADSIEVANPNSIIDYEFFKKHLWRIFAF